MVVFIGIPLRDFYSRVVTGNLAIAMPYRIADIYQHDVR
jgi:hypothetical protein